ncbi:MAG: hypothetical protein GY953_49290, partial [bacterium]|nr:hypothetical protein [bacterium]
MGSYDSLVAEHSYDLGGLSPSVHRLTICVDNSMVHNIGILGHSYGPETQSRWNGIVGDIELVAAPAVAVSSVQIYPAQDGGSVRVHLRVRNATNTPKTAELAIKIHEGHGEKRAMLNVDPGEQVFQQVVKVTKPVRFWDEFQPALYRLTAKIDTDEGSHEVTEPLGFRHIIREGRIITVNNRRIFLRGTLDCALYPKTGHPPMTVAEWLEVLQTVKDYGFNHVRFHTWCPPEAAFEAADQLGVYLAPETPFWVDNWTVQTSSHPKLLGSDDDVAGYVRNEVSRISEAYGNHPSFAFFSIGNEFGMDSDWDLVNRLVTEAKWFDPRRLYNATSARKTVSGDDYWVTHAIGRARVRGVGPPHTAWDYSEALGEASLPVVSHETGQRPVFPDFGALRAKFTGPLKPYNLARLERVLEAHGQAERAGDFQRASARFQYVQYKAEHEALLRSVGSAGYQLLMLTDFTGQSEAFVGILDPFRDEKGFISREEVRQWNSQTVLLARFPSYVWRAGARFSAKVEMAHFGPVDLDGVEAGWWLETASGNVVAAGRLAPAAVPAG